MKVIIFYLLFYVIFILLSEQNKNYLPFYNVFDKILFCRHNRKAVTLSSWKEVYCMFDSFLSVILSVIASVISYYICKWLDR